MAIGNSPTNRSAATALRRWRPDWLLLAIVVGMLGVGIYRAFDGPYQYVEDHEFIPCANAIHWGNLPIRVAQHPAMTIYLLRASSAIFGHTRFGYRALSLLAGIGTILVIYDLARRWWGRGARTAALLLALDGYLLFWSATATDLVFDLCFIAVAMWAFACFLQSERPGWLYLAAVVTGCGFLTKEIDCLLVPVFFLTLLALPQRRWLLRREPWLALMLFALVISPDVWHNLHASPVGRPHIYANYADHLSRFGGIGLNEYPLMFYFGQVREWLGFPSLGTFINPFVAAVLLAGTCWMTLRRGKDSLTVFLLVMFWTVFVFFSLILPHEPSRNDVYLDDVCTYWVDRTTLPAALLAGLALMGLWSRLKAGRQSPERGLAPSPQSASPTETARGDGVCPLSRDGGRPAERKKGDRHRGSDVSPPARPTCATEPVPFFPLPQQALHVVVLTSLALTVRIYAMLGGQPMFFSVRQAQTLDVLGFVLVLSVLAPALLVLAEWLAGRIASRAGRLMHLALVFLLTTAIALPLCKLWAALPAPAMLVLGGVLGALATATYARWAAARTLVTILSPLVLLSPGMFLLGSPAGKYLLRWSEPPPLAVHVGNLAPVVMVIFDEFSGLSLMDANGQLDRLRYPNFAALAADGIWFRNATTVSGETETAIPAILTGNRPGAEDVEPCAAEFPQNLFTLLGNSHRLTAQEPLTSLCPDALCGRPARQMSWRRRLCSELIDAGVLELVTLLPADWPLTWPDISGRWGNFLGQDDDAAGLGDAMTGRRESLEAFIAGIGPTDKPPLYFAHVVLPHSPWCYLPSGKEYSPLPLSPRQQASPWVSNGSIGLARRTQHWTTDAWAVVQARQRHLLQVAMVDRMLGRLLDRLRQVGLYDRSLIVITADHGVAFLPGQPPRTVNRANCPEIMPVPLLMKLPGRHAGSISDRNVESIDILPTIAAVLEVELPRKVAGSSALEPAAPQRPEKTILAEEPLVWDLPFAQRDAALVRLLADFGPGGPVADVFRIGPHRELIGRRVEQCHVAAAPAGRMELLDAGQLAHVDLQAAWLPCHLGGRLLDHVSPSSPRELAVAVNGTIRAVTRTFAIAGLEDAWTAMVPEGALRQGKNVVEVFVIATGKGATTLVPLTDVSVVAGRPAKDILTPRR